MAVLPAVDVFAAAKLTFSAPDVPLSEEEDRPTRLFAFSHVATPLSEQLVLLAGWPARCASSF
jgi:hypothetical protein